MQKTSLLGMKDVFGPFPSNPTEPKFIKNLLNSY